MGTRHLQTVINKAGEKKLNQYGQWDGYPSGQGKSILNFLKEADLEKYNEEISKLREAEQKDYDEVNKFVDKVLKKKLDGAAERKVLQDNPQWYALNRDCGANIHNLILNGKVEFVQYEDDAEADKWCEGFYTINLQTREFISDFHGNVVTFEIDNLPTEEDYLKAFED